MEIFDLALLLLGAKVGGTIFNKLRQPSLVGEILAGIVLGSMLGIVKSSPIVNATSQLGLMFLVLLTTLAIDWKKIENKAEMFSIIEIIMALIIFLVTYFIGVFLNWNFYLRVVIAFALVQSSLVIASRGLASINKLGSPEGESIIGLQVIDDIAAILSVSALSSFLQNSSIGLQPVVKLLFIIVGFIVVMNKTALRFIKILVNYVQKYGMEEALLGITLVLSFLLATFTEQLGIASFLGIFLSGILFSKIPQANIISQKVKEVGESFFIPIFFATIGLSVNVAIAYNQMSFVIPFIIFAISIKLIASSLPFTFFGYSLKESIKIGSGMTSLSEISLIILSIGLSANILDVAMYSIMVVAFLIINMISPILMAIIFKSDIKISYKKRFLNF